MSSTPLSVDEQLFELARTGETLRLAALLDQYPDKLQVRTQPYEQSLLHLAAVAGHLASVDLLLQRGLDVDTRDTGDNTTAMHWAAAAGHLEVVRLLADAGGDVVGHGDDHELEIIGWATCWDECDDAVHRAIAEFLVSRGAAHHIYSSIAMGLADEVRRIVTANPDALSRPMSRNESHQLPLHFAVRKNLPNMVALLLLLGADPAAADGAGNPPTAYAATHTVGTPVLEALAGNSPPDLFIALALGDEATAARLLADQPGFLGAGALHLLAKRGNGPAVNWLLERGVSPNALWNHWGALVTPLHLASWQGHVDVVQRLLSAGADPEIHDSMHDSNALGWAQHGSQTDVVKLLEAHRTGI